MNDVTVQRQRLDKWLFFARVVKSRSLAAALAVGGKVRVNRNKADKASFALKVGDELTITLERKILVYEVLSLGERRGPAAEAQKLYADLTPKVAPSMSLASPISQGARPTKRDRRKLDKFVTNKFE